MDQYIFIIEKTTTLGGNGYAISTAPFFVESDNSNIITLLQIRDSNFSYVVTANERIYMRLYRLSKEKAMKYHKCSEEHVFNQVIRNLIAYYPNPIMDFQQLYDIKLIKNMSYQIGYENQSDIVFKQRPIDIIGTKDPKIYLFNPRITLSRDILDE